MILESLDVGFLRGEVICVKIAQIFNLFVVVTRASSRSGSLSSKFEYLCFSSSSTRRSLVRHSSETLLLSYMVQLCLVGLGLRFNYSGLELLKAEIHEKGRPGSHLRWCYQAR